MPETPPEREPAPAAEPLSAPAVVALQRTHGNAAVQRLLQRAPATTTAPKRPTLHLGSRGPFVWTLQQKLIGAGASLKPDGVVGPRTVLALRRFQRAHGLHGDGVAGAKTWAALDAATAGPPARQAPAAGGGYTTMPEAEESGGYVTMAPAPEEEEEEEGEEYVAMARRQSFSLDDVGDAVGHGTLVAALQSPPRRWDADLQVQGKYRGTTGDAPEDVSSDVTIKAVFALVASEVPKRNEPFRKLFQEYFGWSDMEIDDYVDDRNATLKPGASIRVRYLGTEQERRPYEVTGGGSLMWGWRTPPATVDTGSLFAKEEGAGYGIYVMDASGRIYLGSHHIALFHHSSFLAAAGAAAAGGIMISGGVVRHITNHSGHYLPKIKHLLNVVGELLDRGHPLRRDVAITISDPPKGTPADVTLEGLLRQHKPEWLPRIGVRP